MVLGPGAAVRAATSGHENFKPFRGVRTPQALARGPCNGSVSISSVGYEGLQITSMYCESNDHVMDHVYHICTERPLRPTRHELETRRHLRSSRHVEPGALRRCVPLRFAVVVVRHSSARGAGGGGGRLRARSVVRSLTRHTIHESTACIRPTPSFGNDGVARPPVPARDAVSHAPPVALFEKDGRP